MMRAFEQLKEEYINIGIAKGEAWGEAKGILKIMKEYGSTKESAVEKVITRFPENKEIILKLADEIFIN